jgi:hypothetical protein
MAQIKEFSSADLNTISRFGGVSNTLEKINGVTVVAVPAGAFLLDTYTGAAAAYSVRRIASATTVLLRVRRDTGGGTGDDDEADVAYDSNNELSLDSVISNASAGVTATTLGQFLNVGTVNGTTYTNPDSLTVTALCFVDEWKDQSGSGNHAAQATFGSQPKLYDAATGLITENGKPAIQFDGSNQMFTGNISTSDKTMVAVYRPTAVPTATFQDIICGQRSADSEGNWSFLTMTASDDCQFLGYLLVNKLAASSPTFNQTQKLAEFYYSSGTGSLYRDSTLLDSSSSMTLQSQNSSFSIGNRVGANEFAAFKGQEIILWASDESTNRSGIESDINSNYLIYQPTDAPTSGLLATYTGAAAAYSVRQLSDKAVIALRIRRDSDDEERNIGFDSNGDLDTAAISDFCDTANGYVTRWWDQSTNGNHADQATDGNQPQIYNGTEVITENGKPALDFDGTNDGLNCSTNLRTATGASTVIQVRNVPQRGGSADVQNPLAFYKVQRQLMSPGSAYNQISISTNETADEIIRFTNADLSGQVLHFATWDGSTQTSGIDEVILYAEGAQESGTAAAQVTGVTASGTNCIGYRHDLSSQYCLGTFQEVIVYLTDESSNRTGIESDINGYFSIYT